MHELSSNISIYTARPLHTADNLCKPTEDSQAWPPSLTPGAPLCSFSIKHKSSTSTGGWFLSTTELQVGRKNIRHLAASNSAVLRLQLNTSTSCLHRTYCSTAPAPEHRPSSRKQSSTTRPWPAAKRCSLSAPVRAVGTRPRRKRLKDAVQ